MEKFTLNSINHFLYAILLSILLNLFLQVFMGDWTYDDPFITYRYAENLANGDGFVYNHGEKILSTTTPFFAILLAALKNPFLDIPKIAIIVSLISVSAGALAIWLILQKFGLNFASWFGLILYSLFPAVINTTSSETPLYLALGLFSIYFFLEEKYIPSSLLSGLMVVTRPDGVLLPFILVLYYFSKERKINYKFIIGAGIIICLWFGFAWFYFGDPLPVTLMVKQSQGEMAISQLFPAGFIGLLKNYAQNKVYWIYFIISLLGIAKLTKKQYLPLWIIVSWNALYFLAYTVLGVSRYFWYYAPLVPTFILLSAAGLEWLKLVKISKVRNVIFLLLLIFTLSFQLIGLRNLRTYKDKRIDTYREVGTWVSKNTPFDSKIGVLEVGIIGYYSDRTMIDFAGLIQPDVAKQMKNTSTYQETSIWAIQHYKPNYLILHENFFSNEIPITISDQCEMIKTFNGNTYGYVDMEIYKCNF